MDFTPTEAAADLATLTADIVGRISPADRVAELEADRAPIDTALWAALADAGLLGLAAPESADGADLDTLATVAVAVELGRGLARVPFGSHAVAGVPVIVENGSAVLLERLLPSLVSGETVLAAAIEEAGIYDPHTPTTTLSDGALTGAKVNVPYAAAAGALLVAARTKDGPVIVVVPADRTGISVTETPATGLSPVYSVDFDGVEVDDSEVLAGGRATVAQTVDLLRLAVAADQAGTVEAALAATAEYAREREQFSRPIGSFQAVAQRLADGYIDVQALNLTVTQAAWMLSAGSDAEPGEPTVAIDTAKFWAAEAGHRVAHTTVHVHGGVGLDTSHPAHRYFLRAKQNEFTLGTAPSILDELGTLLDTGR